MKRSRINRVRAATLALALALATGGGAVVAPQADADINACGGGNFCIDYSLLGDANYTEVALSGAFQGNALMALQALRLCDEKSDHVAATATITVAERRSSDGAVSYRQYPDQEYTRGPGAGCVTFNPADYFAPTGKYIWAARADYSYNKLFQLGVYARTQTYHTAWAYNWYLRDWCPTC